MVAQAFLGRPTEITTIAKGEKRSGQSTNVRHLMQRGQVRSPSIIHTSKWLVASLDALVSNHTMESVAHEFACRTLEYRLVLFGLPRYHEAPVDGLPDWRELQSARWNTFSTHKGLVLMLAEPGCSLDILFDEGAGFVV